MKGLRIVEINNVKYDDRGFYPQDKPENLIEWKNIVRAAKVFLVNTVVYESMYYWAFQNDDAATTYWVLIRYQKDDFDLEIKNRYGDPELPHNTKWSEARIPQGTVSNYVIWPQTEIGKAMYVEVKKRIWELDRKILYSKI